MNQPSDGYLHALKPIYGLTDSPGYWWQAFKKYHTEDLSFMQSVLDPCLFYRKDKNQLQGIVGTLVDDTLAAGNEEFSLEEENRSHLFDVKPRDTDFPFKFGGYNINELEDLMYMDQKSCTESLAPINPKSFTPKDFSRLKGQLSVITHGTTPDIAYEVAVMFQISADSSKYEHAVRLNRILESIKTIKIGIVFPMLDVESLCIRGYADTGYGSNEDLSSLLTMLVVLRDKNKNASIIHYAS